MEIKAMAGRVEITATGRVVAEDGRWGGQTTQVLLVDEIPALIAQLAAAEKAARIMDIGEDKQDAKEGEQYEVGQGADSKGYVGGPENISTGFVSSSLGEPTPMRVAVFSSEPQLSDDAGPPPIPHRPIPD